jgi:hypothetical protein
MKPAIVHLKGVNYAYLKTSSSCSMYINKEKKKKKKKRSAKPRCTRGNAAIYYYVYLQLPP